jgi:hypothetical protein
MTSEFESEFEQWRAIDPAAHERLMQIFDLLKRRDNWVAQVFELGPDAPPYPLSPEEHRKVREFQARVEASVLVAETERFLKGDAGPI